MRLYLKPFFSSYVQSRTNKKTDYPRVMPRKWKGARFTTLTMFINTHYVWYDFLFFTFQTSSSFFLIDLPAKLIDYSLTSLGVMDYLFPPQLGFNQIFPVRHTFVSR